MPGDGARRVGRTGARFPSAEAVARWTEDDAPAPDRTGPPPGPARPDPPTWQEPAFAPALRGYDRAQVDAFVAGVREVVRDVRQQLAASERRCRAVEEHAAVTREELHELQRQRAGAPAPADEVGRHVERYLKLARRDAAAIRAQAVAEARQLVERARSATADVGPDLAAAPDTTAVADPPLVRSPRPS